MICSYCNLDKGDQDEKEKVQVLQEDSLSQRTGTILSKINPELIRSTWVEERDLKIYDNLME